MAGLGKRFPRRYKYYEILEISKNATQEEIKKAFRYLAQKWHPDRNPGNSQAETKFKKINEAYQVLSNPSERAAYDSALAECPVCWTYEVVQVGGNNYRCRHCGCQFDVFGAPLSETIERAAISGRYRVRLTAFQSMQCSWCRRFFTQPFLCPDRKLHSGCFFFKKLSEDERDRFLNDERWWWRIVDLVRQAENNGVIKKCTKCGALNPNPEKFTCWQCGHNIYDRCPNCDLPTLHFDLDDNYWKCANAKCYGKKFTFEKERARYKQYKRAEEYASQGVASNKCPECGHNLRFDAAMLLWRCPNPRCRRIYTYEELCKARRGKPGQKRFVGSIPPRGKFPWHRISLLYILRRFRGSLRRTWNGIPISVRKLFLNLLVIISLVVVARTGYLLFTHQSAAVEKDTIIFLAEFGFWIWIISILRSYRYRRRKPSFRLVFFSVLGIALVCAFAGVEPLASYKDRTISFVGLTWHSVTAPSQFPTPTPAEPTPVPAKPPQTVQTEVSYTNEEVEGLIYVLINNERQRFGMTALEKDPLLASLAREHSVSMVEHQFFSHNRATGQRNLDYEQPPDTIRGENISKTPCRKWVPGPYLTLQEVCAWVVSGWMSSTGHRGNILEARFSKTGVGVGGQGEYLYITQIFEGTY